MADFISLMQRAEALRRLEGDPIRGEWWAGYLRGLRRAHHAEIRLRAERRLGEMLKDSPKAKGSKGRGKKGAKRGTLSEPRIEDPPTLASVGITKKESSRSQELAAVSEAEFEAALGHGYRGGLTLEAREPERSTGDGRNL